MNFKVLRDVQGLWFGLQQRRDSSYWMCQNKALFTCTHLRLFVVEEIRNVQKINKCTLGCAAEMIIYKNVLICKEFFMFLVETQLQFLSLHGDVVYRETVILKMHWALTACLWSSDRTLAHCIYYLMFLLELASSALCGRTQKWLGWFTKITLVLSFINNVVKKFWKILNWKQMMY